MFYFTLFLIFAAIILRFLPHPPNFAPIGALALFSGVYLGSRRRWTLLVPLAAMLISDVFLGFASLWVTFSVYVSFALIGILGLWISRHKTISNIIGGSLLGSCLFYAITNFAVWAATPLYSKTWVGLTQCYIMAIPFFRNTLLGDFFYVGVMFGSYELVQYLIRRRKTALASSNS